MITSSTAKFVLETGSERFFSNSSIVIEPTYLVGGAAWNVLCRIVSGADSTIVIDFFNMRVTKADADAQTGAGTGDTAKLFNALEKHVKATLEAISENSSTVFTIV